MKITLTQIKQLREQTQAGILDARTALEQSDGDIGKAKQWLTKRGLDKAAKKADRETTEGAIVTYVHTGGKVGALIKLGCETDFVAKTDEFLQLGREIAMQVASMDPESVEELLTQAYIRDSKKTIEAMIKETIAKLGENVVVVEFERLAI